MRAAGWMTLSLRAGFAIQAAEGPETEEIDNLLTPRHKAEETR